MQDYLKLKNMIFYGCHGVAEAEKELGRRFEVDVEIAGDFQTAGSIDDLNHTINYAEVYCLAKKSVEGKKFNLVEAVAEDIAQGILATFAIKEVLVRVRKIAPPVGGIMDYAEVEIRRKK